MSLFLNLYSLLRFRPFLCSLVLSCSEVEHELFLLLSFSIPRCPLFALSLIIGLSGLQLFGCLIQASSDLPDISRDCSPWSEVSPSPLLLSLLVCNNHYASRIHTALILRNQCSLESPTLQEEAQNNLMSDASLWYPYLKSWQKYNLFHAREPPQVYGDNREPQMHFD